MRGPVHSSPCFWGALPWWTGTVRQILESLEQDLQPLYISSSWGRGGGLRGLLAGDNPAHSHITFMETDTGALPFMVLEADGFYRSLGSWHCLQGLQCAEEGPHMWTGKASFELRRQSVGFHRLRLQQIHAGQFNRQNTAAWKTGTFISTMQRNTVLV